MKLSRRACKDEILAYAKADWIVLYGLRWVSAGHVPEHLGKGLHYCAPRLCGELPGKFSQGDYVWRCAPVVGARYHYYYYHHLALRSPLVTSVTTHRV